MNQNVALLHLGDLFAVNVKFKNGSGEYVSKEYTYLSSEPIKVGAEVIVESPYSGNVVVRVESCEQSDFDILADYEYKFVVQVVSTEAHEKRKNLIAELKKQMRSAIHRKQQKELVEQLGLEDDDTFNKVLKKAKKMFGGLA